MPVDNNPHLVLYYSRTLHTYEYVKAILSRTTTDEIKSKMKSTEISTLVLDVYITPKELAQLVETYFDTEFELEIKPAYE